MSQLVGLGQDQVGMTATLPRLPVERRGSDAVSWNGRGISSVKYFLRVIACVGLLVCWAAAQQDSKQAGAVKNTTVIGCLAGPDGDDLYTLTSMQHRDGVSVAGGEELKKGVGAKVKLTGTWETLPGADASKGDAAKRFRATEIVVMDEKCQAPQPVTPVNKKKQAQKK